MINHSQQRLKFTATINDEALSEDTSPEFALRYVDIGNVDSSGTIHEIVDYTFANAPSRARRIVRDGDVIISTVRTYLQAIAPIRNPPEGLVVSTGFAVIRPMPGILDANYCKYALREPGFLWEVVTRSVGVSYPAINASEIGDIPIHLPQIDIQCRIAAYLDREIQEIDALISAKERLLVALKEKRQAYVTHAVTRGLNPDAALCDSGVAMLGKIPLHWNVKRLKFLANVRTGLTIGKDYGTRSLSEYFYLRVANVQDGFVSLDDVTTVLVPKSEAASCLLQCGDVLMNEGGDIDKLGRGCVWRGEVTPCLHQNHVFAVRPHSVDSDWLATWTATTPAKSYFENRAKRTTNLASISSWNIKELPVPLPPEGEQKRILSEVKKVTIALDTLRDSAERTIGLLKDRRAAIIAAAVTGQLPLEDSQCC